MKINKFNKLSKLNQSFKWLMMLFLCFYLSGCTDNWDSHYDNTKMNSGNSLLVALQKDSSLTVFLKMVKIAKMETRISNAESFTIWAPNNSSLTSYQYLLNAPVLTTLDSASIALVVKNHIGRYFKSTSEITGIGINVGMINGKFILFKKEGAGFTFGGMALDISKSNHVCSNGVLHVIQGVIPFVNNTWETIKSNPEYSTMFNYINTFDSTFMDPYRSIKIGINSKGQSVFDTVFIFSNKLMNRIGSINTEDSTYTTILPSNTAFSNAYNIYKNYYKSNGGMNGKLKADSVTNVNTNYAIIKDLIFRGVIDVQSSDSLISSTGTVFHKPADMFIGATKVPVSNGVIYKTDQLRTNLIESILNPVKLEMENLRYGTSVDLDVLVLNATSRIFPYEYLIPGVSGGYVLLEPTSLSSKPYVEATLRGSLSGTYDIYCTIVPGNAEDTTNVKEQTILDFSLGYFEGKTWKTKTLLNGVITDMTSVQEILVSKDVSIPFFDSKASLIIQVNVPSSQTSIYSRSVRIDNIRLVPKVQ